MCTLSTIYLICTNQPCSAVTDRRPAWTPCPRARRAARRHAYLASVAATLRSALLAGTGIRPHTANCSSSQESSQSPSSSPSPSPSSNTEATPCKAAADVAVTSHFAFQFSLCDACLVTCVPGGEDRLRWRIKRDSAWGAVAVPGRRSGAVDFVDVYERMIAAGAEPRDVSPLITGLEERMWSDFRASFVEIQRGLRHGSEGGALVANWNSVGSWRSPRGWTREEERYSRVDDEASETDTRDESVGAPRLADVDAQRRTASPEAMFAHDMLWRDGTGMRS